MDKNMTTPPAQLGRARGIPAVKPKNMKGTLIRLWRLTKGHRKGLGWILLLSALASGSAILSPYLIGEVVNCIDQGDIGLQLMAILMTLYLGDWLIRFLQQFLMAGTGQRMIFHIRISLFAHMEKLPLSFFDTRQHGELMSRLTNDVDNISVTISDSLTQLMMYVFTIVGIFCVMVYMSPVLTIVALLAVLMIFWLTRAVTKRTKILFRQQQTILGKLNGQVEESISGISMVKAFGQEQEMVEQFVENNDAFCRVAAKAQIASGYLMPMMNVINNLTYVLIAIVSGVMALKGKLTVGEISSFLLYSRQFSRPFVEIANIYNNFQTAVAGAERILEILDEECEPKDVDGAKSAADVCGAVSFRDVTFGYRSDKPILEHINLCHHVR